MFLVASARSGSDYDNCYEWGITGEQWQDAIFAALEEWGITGEQWQDAIFAALEELSLRD